MHVHVRCAKCEERKRSTGSELGVWGVGRMPPHGTFSATWETWTRTLRLRSSSCLRPSLYHVGIPTVLHRHGDAYSAHGRSGSSDLLRAPSTYRWVCLRVHDVLHCAADATLQRHFIFLHAVQFPFFPSFSTAANTVLHRARRVRCIWTRAMARGSAYGMCCPKSRTNRSSHGRDDGGGSVRRQRVRDAMREYPLCCICMVMQCIVRRRGALRRTAHTDQQDGRQRRSYRLSRIRQIAQAALGSRCSRGRTHRLQMDQAAARTV